MGNGSHFPTPGLPNPVATFLDECAISILNSAGSYPTGVENFSAYQLDLFLFKDMGLGGILSKFISRANDPEIGGFEGFTCQASLHMVPVLLDRDAVLAAQVASPGTQVTIQFIAVAIEEAETVALSLGQTLQEYLEA